MFRNLALCTLHFTLAFAALAANAAREKVEPAAPARAQAPVSREAARAVPGRALSPRAPQADTCGGLGEAALPVALAAELATAQEADIPAIVAAALANAASADIPAIVAAIPEHIAVCDAPAIAAALAAALARSDAKAVSPAALAALRKEWYERFTADGGSRASWILRIARDRAKRGESTEALRAAFLETVWEWMNEE